MNQKKSIYLSSTTIKDEKFSCQAYKDAEKKKQKQRKILKKEIDRRNNNDEY